MQIKYKINDNEHQIYFCKKNQFHKITECLEKSQSDKNILFVYDDNVNKETIINYDIGGRANKKLKTLVNEL